jgi:predicted nucleic acid-binding protein
MYLLDTNILSFLFRKSPKIEQKLKETSFSQIYTCSIVFGEIYSGVEKISDLNKKQILRDYYLSLESDIQILDFDLKSAKIFAKIRTELQKAGDSIEDFDLMIASICLSNNLIMVTNNVKHFERIKGLRLEDWINF